MIGDMKQPAKNWLADHLNNFGTLLEAGEDPSCLIKIGGVELELRLNTLPGIFERHTIPIVDA